MKNIRLLTMALCSVLLAFGCATSQKARFAADSRKFLQAEDADNETFRVLLSSKSYDVVQLRYKKYIKKAKDTGGDRYMMAEMKKYDIIDEARVGILKVWLFPDSGRIMKVRPEKITYLEEIDTLLLEDIQRWGFKFPKRVIEPNIFYVKYRVVLNKNKSDEEIIEDVQKRMMEKQ